MFKALPVVLLVGFLPINSLFSGWEDSASEATDDWATITDQVHRYSIKHPKEWILSASSAEHGEGMAVKLLAPTEGAASLDFRESINLVTETVGHAITPEEYLEAGVERLENIFEDLQILDKEEIFINGVTGHQVVFRAKALGTELQWKQVYLVSLNRVFVWTYSGDQTDFDTYLTSVDQILDSFEVIP